LLSEQLESQNVSIAHAAEIFSVSTATIRNWIKTGYLELEGKGRVSSVSIDNFRNDIAGKEKLNARANKSLKDSHNHIEVQLKIKKILNDGDLDAESVGTEYEEALSSSYRNKEGIYYTPLIIAERFFNWLPENRSNLTFCDPCCGTGNFLLAAIDNGFKPENVFGYDTDPIAVEIAKRRILERTGCKAKNLICNDFFEVSQNNKKMTFDVIITNPPWGKKIEKEQKSILSKKFGAGKSLDTSALFFFGCLAHIKDAGYLGLLLPDAFFNVASFEDARKKALSLRIKALIDFGKPFRGLMTKAKGILIQNQNFSIGNEIVACEVNQQQSTRVQESFMENPKSILNFATSSNECRVIKHLYSLPHGTLANHAKYGLGIVTGNNKKFCVPNPKQNYIPVYKGADIHKDKLDKPTCYIPNDFSLYQQVAPIELFIAKEKLIYKFISSDLVFYLDTKQRYVLNSANMLVLNKDFPISAKQLSELLNSEIINWLFRSIFETHKILRSDIESLPIHIKYFDNHDEFNEEEYLNFLGVEEVQNGTYRIKN